MTAPDLEVILTHEHTDFDALASMLGAALLYPHALPVLPRRLNRNVAGFLVLYRNHFPFITDRDLPKARIARAILVDSRAVNWIKGMDSSTPQLIIDHHKSDEPPAPNQQILAEPVGANTTLLVERIMDAGIQLTPLQATLLTLGIHEDTGSLTYPSTTQRDARALAWLLAPDHNVNLQVVGQFLAHPLSESQRALLQQLIDNSEFVEIAGHTVVIAQAQATGFTEELSALAGRLRDFHETDAIFMVINLGDVIQVVARSTTDEVDVGKVASELGGGGHARAAAAPVRATDGGTLAVRNRIVGLLEQTCRAAVTVQHIMSHGRPQTLSPEMTIAAAAELMRRYGHEGFPVLETLPDGREQLLGVLTRREADRALTHELGDQPVARFMRAGNVTIRPDASVNELRRRMIESDWGQIPVVDDQGRIIGIATRTDLIKLWDAASLPRHHAPATAAKLAAGLPPLQHALLRLIGEEVSLLGYSAYVVGGFVRDLLLNGRRSNGKQHDISALDMDIVIEGNAIAFARRMQSLYGGRIVPHQRFNTAKWLLDDRDQPVDRAKLLAALAMTDAAGLPAHLDFVTARTEFYTAPTALPTVEGSSIKLDLHRRDFTINTLALCLNPDRWAELLDFYGGLNDLEQGIIRVLHSLSFVDDATRILRAVRYEQRFGFRIEPRTLELLRDAIDLLNRVTPTRIRHELERILFEEVPEKALSRLYILGVLARIHPALRVDGWVEDRCVALRALRQEMPQEHPLNTIPAPLLYWGILVYRLSETTHAELAERLGLRSKTQRLMRGLAHLRRAMDELAAPELPAGRIVTLLDPIPTEALHLAPIVGHDSPEALARIHAYETSLRHIHPELDGHSLAALGIPRGPLYGALLNALRAAKLDGRVSTREDEVEFVRRYLANSSTETTSPRP